MVLTAERPETSLETINGGPICELPAIAVWLASGHADPRSDGFSSIRVAPDGEYRALIEAATAVSMIRLRCDGFASREIWLPAKVLQVLRGKHPEASLLAVRQGENRLVSIRSFAEDSTICWSVTEPGPGFQRLPELPVVEAQEARPVRFDAALLRTAAAQLAALAVDVAILQHGWGLELKLTGEGFEGELALLGLRD
jgi:hypothetical protein